MVETAHDRALEENAEQAAGHGAEQHGQREWHAGVIGVGRHIAAHGDELAVGHVDDPHHPEDDREARGGQHEKGEHIGDLIDKRDDLGRLHFASLTTLRQAKRGSASASRPERAQWRDLFMKLPPG